MTFGHIFVELINQIANIQLSKLAEETAKESLELTQTSYANGAVNIVQLLDAQINYLESQLSSSTANYNYLLRTMQLERYIGFFFFRKGQPVFLQRVFWEWHFFY